MVYDPADPNNAVVIDGLPGSFRVDNEGRIQTDNSRAALLVTIVPALAIVGNGAYALYSFF